jgi:hypothetical protein
MDWEPHDRHWIRLRGPWEVCWIEEGTPQPTSRVKLPATWQELFGERAGTARFVRRFQAPARLDPDERVCITLLDAGGEIRCRVNGILVEPLAVPLGDPACWPHERCLSFDVTDLLQPSNRLTLDVTVRDAAAPNAGLHQPVLLEIVTLDEDDAAG